MAPLDLLHVDILALILAHLSLNDIVTLCQHVLTGERRHVALLLFYSKIKEQIGQTGSLLQIQCPTPSHRHFDHIALQRRTAVFRHEFIHYSTPGPINEAMILQHVSCISLSIADPTNPDATVKFVAEGLLR